MRGFWAIYKRELFSLFVTPLAWILISVFLMIQGFHFELVITRFATQGDLLIDSAAVQMFFGGTIAIYLPIFFICPLLTMRLFAEERKSGTIEALMTAPVGTVGVVLAKYLATLTTYIALWAPTGIYFFVLSRYGDVDFHLVGTSYLAIFMVGAGYLSIGTLTSALTSSQLIAAVLSGILIIGLFMMSFGEILFEPGGMHDLASYVSVWSLMGEFSRGLVDSRRLIYTAILILVPLFFTVRTVDAWRWG